MKIKLQEKICAEVSTVFMGELFCKLRCGLLKWIVELV